MSNIQLIIEKLEKWNEGGPWPLHGINGYGYSGPDFEEVLTAEESGALVEALKGGMAAIQDIERMWRMKAEQARNGLG